MGCRRKRGLSGDPGLGSGRGSPQVSVTSHPDLCPHPRFLQTPQVTAAVLWTDTPSAQPPIPPQQPTTSLTPSPVSKPPAPQRPLSLVDTACVAVPWALCPRNPALVLLCCGGSLLAGPSLLSLPSGHSWSLGAASGSHDGHKGMQTLPWVQVSSALTPRKCGRGWVPLGIAGCGASLGSQRTQITAWRGGGAADTGPRSPGPCCCRRREALKESSPHPSLRKDGSAVCSHRTGGP